MAHKGHANPLLFILCYFSFLWKPNIFVFETQLFCIKPFFVLYPAFFWKPRICLKTQLFLKTQVLLENPAFFENPIFFLKPYFKKKNQAFWESPAFYWKPFFFFNPAFLRKPSLFFVTGDMSYMGTVVGIHDIPTWRVLARVTNKQHGSSSMCYLSHFHMYLPSRCLSHYAFLHSCDIRKLWPRFFDWMLLQSWIKLLRNT